MRLDITKLIEVAEAITTDDQIGFAAKITMPVQTLTDEDGTEYELEISLTIKE